MNSMKCWSHYVSISVQAGSRLNKISLVVIATEHIPELPPVCAKSCYLLDSKLQSVISTYKLKYVLEKSGNNLSGHVMQCQSSTVQAMFSGPHEEHQYGGFDHGILVCWQLQNARELQLIEVTSWIG